MVSSKLVHFTCELLFLQHQGQGCKKKWLLHGHYVIFHKHSLFVLTFNPMRKKNPYFKVCHKDNLWRY